MEGNRRNVRTILTHTGKIYVDIDNQLEFLTVGDYGKENNIKADFLGLTKEIHGVENTAVDLSKKWVATISTQKGCPMHCKFCDVPKFGFYGNASIEDMERQIRTIIEGESIKETDRFNVHFARMGEPTWNENVLAFGLALKGIAKSAGLVAKTIHPVVSTMLPKANSKLGNFLQVWCSIKNEFYNGEAGLQLSINSTDDGQRSELFSSRSLSLTAQTILDARKLSELFDKDKFIVKITPIHETTSAIESGLQITGYTDYDVYRHFEQPLLEEGWDVIVFVPSKEEDSDRITCGNALIAFNNY